jgi:hypothetical protein
VTTNEQQDHSATPAGEADERSWNPIPTRCWLSRAPPASTAMPHRRTLAASLARRLRERHAELTGTQIASPKNAQRAPRTIAESLAAALRKRAAELMGSPRVTR